MAPPRGMTRVASHEHQNQEHVMVLAPRGGQGGANACLGCCDARIAAIVVNAFLILGGAITFSLGQQGLVASRNVDWAAATPQAAEETAKRLKIVSIGVIISGIIQLVFAAIGMWGAIAFRAELVRANAKYVVFSSLINFVFPLYAGGVVNIFALVPLLLFVQPQLQFAKEVEEGQMEASTYRPACCCCPRPVLLAVPIETGRPVGSEETFDDEPQEDSIIEMATTKAG